VSVETIETVVVGAGQAGLAISEHLSNNKGAHVVLERHRIAERWRSERWDSLVANGPAWHDRFPSMEFSDVGPDEFAHKEKVAAYFEAYADLIKAPVRCGVEVLNVRRNEGRPGFRVETSEGVIDAINVVAATGPFQHPIIPPVVPQDTQVLQIHSNAYRNPEQLPSGATLVVGAGSSGSQIANELMRSGRQIYLSVGPHDRPPRSYRGRDFVWWLGVLGKWDASAVTPGTEHVTISVSGAHGGQTVDFRRLAQQGMNLVGLTESFNNGVLHFAGDLAKNIAHGDANYLSVLQEADNYILRNGLNFPMEPDAHIIDSDPECLVNPLSQLNLKDAGINSIIWATGFVSDYSWLQANAFDEAGKPKHQRGVSAEPGIYFIGLPWQSRRGSSFIWGVWHDAKYIADMISKQRFYFNYQPSDVKNEIDQST